MSDTCQMHIKEVLFADTCLKWAQHDCKFTCFIVRHCSSGITGSFTRLNYYAVYTTKQKPPSCCKLCEVWKTFRKVRLFGYITFYLITSKLFCITLVKHFTVSLLFIMFAFYIRLCLKQTLPTMTQTNISDIGICFQACSW